MTVKTKNNPKTITTRQGFTLVEVIVVAVIVIILAAVAIPLYNGFIRQARQDAVENLAETTAAAVNSYWRKTGRMDGTNALPLNDDDGFFSDTLKIYYDKSKHKITLTRESGDTKGFITVDDIRHDDAGITAKVDFQ